MPELIEKWQLDVLESHSGSTRWHREAAKRKAAPGATAGTARRGHGWRRSPADEQVLQFATLHGLILLRQAAKWFYKGVASTANQRVTKMVQAGLLTRDAGAPDWAGTVLLPTLAGQAVGLEGLPPVFDSLRRRYLTMPDNLLHAALVADRVLVAQSRGVRTLSERQIRLLDKQDPDVVVPFLESLGVRFAQGLTDPGVRPGEVMRPVRQPGGGVLFEPHQTFLSAAVASPGQGVGDTRFRSVRFPDFVEVVSSTGELIAVEVEIADKAADRLRGIVAGYGRAVPRRRSDGFGGFERDAAGRLVLERRQFRQVKWLCSPDASTRLKGRLDPARGVWSGGYIPDLLPTEFPADYAWLEQKKAAVMLVDDATADDAGLQYALDQRVLYPMYRCSYRHWLVWRDVWRDEVPSHARPMLPFARWISVGENIRLCRIRTDGT